MSDTLLELENRVRRLIHETADSSSYFSSTLIKELISKAYIRRCSQAIMAFEGFFVKTAQQIVTADQKFYSWPSGFERMHKLEFITPTENVDYSSPTYPVEGNTTPILRFERHAEPNYTMGGAPYRYRPTGGGFFLEPTPASTFGVMNMEYSGVVGELENDTDTLDPDFPVNFEELLVLDAAVKCLDSEGALERGPIRSILRERRDWELDWERYIDARMVSRQSVQPFAPHYEDS